jgi:hypothetical protein
MVVRLNAAGYPLSSSSLSYNDYDNDNSNSNVSSHICYENFHGAYHANKAKNYLPQNGALVSCVS